MLSSRIDHVAVAVPDGEQAQRRWRDELGGGLSSWGEEAGFRIRQIRFAGGGKLELLSPPADAPPDNFVQRFLARFGSQLHHVTLMVPDIHGALDAVEEAGLDAVDVQTSDHRWRELFLRPSQVGGFIVQVAWSGYSQKQWEAEKRYTAEPPREDAPTLLGPRLRHPDLDRAAWLWGFLGAEVTRDDGVLRCRWPGRPLDVEVVHGDQAGPVCLRMTDTKPRPAEDGFGPEVCV
jgi:methylmalonyl-CoA/ethylmalonyl-CoA epimerase